MENRVEKTVIREDCPQFELLDEFCHQAKNLYNYANYILRQKYKEQDYSLQNFYKLRNYLRHLEDEQNPWGRQANPHIAAGVVQDLVNAWKSYFASLKSFKNFPEKWKACPKPPRYLKKDGLHPIILDHCKIKDGMVVFPRVFKGFTVPFIKMEFAEQTKMVRVIPRYKHFVIEVVYKVELPELQEDTERYLSIDLGVSNFAAITSNVPGFRSIVLNGKGLKSINQWYNKEVARYRSIAKQMNGVKSTNRIKAITNKRTSRINDILHKMSRYVINLAKEWNCSRIVVGYNPGWKQDANLGRVNNQNFVQLPYLRFLQQLMYKAEDIGLQVIPTEEDYTSKTSFLDGEFPDKKDIYLGTRKTRGMFISQQGIKINADVNASYQILKKVFPNAYIAEGIEGVSLHPIRVDVC